MLLSKSEFFIIRHIQFHSGSDVSTRWCVLTSMWNMAKFLLLFNRKKVKRCETNHLSSDIEVQHFQVFQVHNVKSWLAATKQFPFGTFSYNWPLSSYLRALLYLETHLNIPSPTDRWKTGKLAAGTINFYIYRRKTSSSTESSMSYYVSTVAQMGQSKHWV